MELMRDGRAEDRKTRGDARELASRPFDWDLSADNIRASSHQRCITGRIHDLHPNVSLKPKILLHPGRRPYMRPRPETRRSRVQSRGRALSRRRDPGSPLSPSGTLRPGKQAEKLVFGDKLDSAMRSDPRV